MGVIMSETFRFKELSHLSYVLGPNKEVLQKLRNLGVKIKVHGLSVKVLGGAREFNEYAVSCIRERKKQAETGNVEVSRKSKNKGQSQNPQGPQKNRREAPLTEVAPPRVHIIPKNASQKEYIKKIKNNDVIFGIGSAGTGKTFLAVACGLQDLEQKKIEKIIITRPAVEAGEKLGFLPGSFAEKVDPYLQPIYDAINTYCGKAHLQMMRKENIIEIAPIAYLRGRTFHNAYVILDEAQNCTFTQLLMVLTRLGQGSKCVITGDTSQIDLPLHQSGLSDIIRKLEGVDGVATYAFSAEDVVRHPVVAKIIRAVEARQDLKSHRDNKKERFEDGWADDYSFVAR